MSEDSPDKPTGHPKVSPVGYSRREARRLAVVALYSMEITGNPSLGQTVGLLEAMKPEDPEWPQFTWDLCKAYLDNRAKIDADLSEVLDNWTLDRVAPLERSILRLGCAEMRNFSDIPPRVTINEFIELARLYCEDQAPRFVNGILDRIAKRLAKPDSYYGKSKPSQPESE